MTQPDMSPEPGVAPPPVMTHPDVRSYSFTASDEALADLRRRIVATHWPDKETVTDESQGVQFATTQALARYWAAEYDWRVCRCVKLDWRNRAATERRSTGDSSSQSPARHHH